MGAVTKKPRSRTMYRVISTAQKSVRNVLTLAKRQLLKRLPKRGFW